MACRVRGRYSKIDSGCTIAYESLELEAPSVKEQIKISRLELGRTIAMDARSAVNVNTIAKASQGAVC